MMENLLRRIGLVALLLAVAGGLYGAYLDAPMVFDDFQFFDFSYVSRYAGDFAPFNRRFWPYASFAHQHLLLGHDVVGMRAGNVLLHVAAALLLAMVVQRLLALSAPPKSPEPSLPRSLAAAAVALAFLAHPVAVYAVAYLVERSTVMATLFALSMWLSFLHAIQSGKIRWLWLSVLCFYFAVFSKEHAVLAPFMPLASALLLRQRIAPGIGWRALVPAFAAYAVIALLVAASHTTYVGTTYEPLLGYVPEGPDWHRHWLGLERIHWMSMLSQGGLFFKYLWLWLWPDPSAMSVDMREALVADLGDWANWLGIAGYLTFGAMSAALLWRGGRTGLVGLGLLIPWALFIVELATVRVQEPFVLYRSYLWMPGLMIAIAVGLESATAALGWQRSTALCLAAFCLLAYGAEQRLATFASDKLLWDDAVRLFEARRSPGSTAERAYYNRGVAYARGNDYGRALSDFEKALAFNPNFYLAYQMRGQVQVRQGRLDEGLDSFDQALRIRPGFAPVQFDRADVLERLGRSQESLAELKRTCDAGFLMACYVRSKRLDPKSSFTFKSK